MIMLNLPELQELGSFAMDLVITEEDGENKIFAFEQEEQQHWLVLLPHAFYSANKQRSACDKQQSKAFAQMMCLCSSTITVPLHSNIMEEVGALLSTYCLVYRYKRGKSVAKFYLEADCRVTYLDFVTFQAVQYNEKCIKELMAMKKSNSYQFCLTFFKDKVLPSLFTSEEESI